MLTLSAAPWRDFDVAVSVNRLLWRLSCSTFRAMPTHMRSSSSILTCEATSRFIEPRSRMDISCLLPMFSILDIFFGVNMRRVVAS